MVTPSPRRPTQRPSPTSSSATTKATWSRPYGSPRRARGHFAFVVIHRRPSRAPRRCAAPGPARRRDRQRRDVPRLERGRLPQGNALGRVPRRRRDRRVTPDGSAYVNVDGTPTEHERVELDWDDEGAEKAGYETFMLKEIYEQPDAVAETIGDRVRHGTLVLEGLDMSGQDVKELQRIVLVARYGVPRLRRRALRHRGVGAHPGRVRHRVGMGLSEPGDRRAHARHRDLAVGRDTRHDRGAEARTGEGRAHGRDHEHDGLADHARSRLRALHVQASRCRSHPRRRSPPRLRSLSRRTQAGGGTRDASPGRDRVHPRLRLQASAQDSSFLEADHPIEEIARRYHDAPFFLYLGRHIGLPVALEGALC